MSKLQPAQIFGFLRAMSLVKVGEPIRLCTCSLRSLICPNCRKSTLRIHIASLATQTTLTEVLIAIGTAIFIYDYFVTLGMEINLVWASQWNFVKFLFLFQRYMPFFDTFVLWVYQEFGGYHSPTVCKHITISTLVMTIVGTIASEILLTIRIWALWSPSRRLTILLPIAFLLVWVPAVISAYYFTIDLEFWDGVSLVLIAIPGIKAYKSGAMSGLGSVVYHEGKSLIRDSVLKDELTDAFVPLTGAAFYFFLFVLSLTNIVIYAKSHGATRAIITNSTRYLHTIVASRVILHMREKVYGTNEDESPSRIISNLFLEAQFDSGTNERREQDNQGRRPKLRRLRIPVA
ncbi:hypothetical protein CPC08DRAFT_751309 [Agrocybe pediades]|nr:hypothetical protein CPC08DRAFT_751309 [Agrocybe pediades]